MEEEYGMRTRRRFSAEFKARVALEALRGDKTVQEIAANRAQESRVTAYQRRLLETLARAKYARTGEERAHFFRIAEEWSKKARETAELGRDEDIMADPVYGAILSVNRAAE